MITTFVAWVACLGFIALLLYHLRLRSSIARLGERFRSPDDQRTKAEPERRILTPSSVQQLTQQINQQLDERIERIALENRQKRLTESILDQFEDGFLIVRDDLRIGFANNSARRTFAHKPDIINLPAIEAFLDHRNIQVMPEALEQQEKRTSTIRMEERVEQKGQQMDRYIMVEAGPLPFPMQGVPGVWVILRDESERHHLEQIRRDFVANASHELRTPLSIITGYLENLIDGDVTDPEMMDRFLAVMNKHAIRLGRIVEDMLTISKLENNSELIRSEPFDLLESASDMVEHLQLLIVERDANVVIDMPEDRSIIGDRYYWDQIFFNLIENSLKQNDQAGFEIEIKLRPDQTNENFILEISDNGVGIPSSDLPHVFKRFYRVEKTHSSKEVKGTGLGLSIVNRAIEAHGGTLTVDSQPGIRTTFQITLPKPASQAE
ncbi:MAG: ATP-binding protein [Verrucomicrobiota bacterium]